MANLKSQAIDTPFLAQLRQALEHYHDPDWLGTHSPLAAPYFLGRAFAQRGQATSVRERGKALQSALEKAALALWGGIPPEDKDALLEAAYAERDQKGVGNYWRYLLLELRYFCRFFQLPQRKMIWEDVLYVAKATYHRHLDEAERALGKILLHQCHPSFRLELPPLNSAQLVGRKEAERQSLHALRSGRTIWISGASGVGKTALGAAVAAQWSPTAVFWLTIRPRFTDQLSSLLFSLGYFLHQCGASVLWRQLVADNGQIKNLQLALGLARHDLEAIRSSANALPLVLCVDDVDLLSPSVSEQQTEVQAQALTFLEGLRGYAAMLLMGQRVTIAPDVHVNLDRLSRSEVAEMLTMSQISYEAKDLEILYRYTSGHPRLLALCLSLRRDQDNLSTVLPELPQHPLLQPLFARVWQRLDAEKRALLQALSVFQTAVPRHAWQVNDDAFPSLMAQNLLQEDEQGGVSLLPAWREMVYAHLSAEQKEPLHLQAASLRAAAGAYTSAAYHYWQGGDVETAVSLWYENRAEEIRHGRAARALALFRQISARHLKKSVARKLALIRGELHQLIGETEQALLDFQAVEWSPQGEDTVAASLLWGSFLESSGKPAQAMEKYQQGIDVAIRLIGQATRLHAKRSLAAMRQKNMDVAWHEGQLVHYEAENLQGILQDERGNFAEARRHYRFALSLAEDLGYDEGIARTNVNLAVLAGRKSEIDAAKLHLETALSFYEKIGDTFQREIVRANLAGAYVQAQQHSQAIAPALEAFNYFQQISHSLFMAVTASNLAEAYAGVENWEMAAKYAHQVLQLEETRSYPYALYTLGNVMRARQDLEQARSYFRQAVDAAEQNGDDYMCAYAWRELGRVDYALGATEKSDAALQKALQLFRNLQMEKEVAEMVKELAI